MRSIIIFDLETNGLHHSSVLSIGAIKVRYLPTLDNFGVEGTFNRYYFRHGGEPTNDKAIAVNGLTDEAIQRLRKDADYPLYFTSDLASFETFSRNASLFVAHNIDFDVSFIPFLSGKRTFCTMKSNISISPTKKWPTLTETARHFGIEIEIKQLHSSTYDSYLVYEVFCAMYRQRHLTLIDSLSYLR